MGPKSAYYEGTRGANVSNFNQYHALQLMRAQATEHISSAARNLWGLPNGGAIPSLTYACRHTINNILFQTFGMQLPLSITGRTFGELNK